MGNRKSVVDLLEEGPQRGLSEAYAGIIPAKKLHGAVEGVAKGQVNPDDVVLIQDQTLFGSATDGMLFTRTKMFDKPAFSDMFSCNLYDIVEVRYKEGIIELTSDVTIVLKDGFHYTFNSNVYFKSAPMVVDWLNEVAEAARFEHEYADAASSSEVVEVEYEEVSTDKTTASGKVEADADFSGRRDAAGLGSDRSAETAAGAGAAAGAAGAGESAEDEVEDAVEVEIVDKDDLYGKKGTTMPTVAEIKKPQLPPGYDVDLFTLLTQKFRGATGNGGYAAPDIPERKLNGSVSSVAQNKIKPEEALLVYDATVFGSATDGMLFTVDTIYVKDMMEDPVSFKYEDILKVEHFKTEKKSGVKLYMRNDRVISMPVFASMDALMFAHWFQAVVDVARYERAVAAASGENVGTKMARRNLDQMPHEIQFKYMLIISNFLLSDDGLVDAREAGLFYALLARIKLTAADRYQLRMYQADPEHVIPTQQLVKEITSDLDRLAVQQILNSLVKDMVNIYLQAKTETSVYSGKSSDISDDGYLNHPFIKQFAEDNGISREQVKFIRKAIAADNKIFDDNVDDAGLNSAFSSVAAAAGAVGVPLAALYFSGSVIGLSAAGITSGLSALGLGGLFGLSGMVTGIGAVILIGLGANKGIKMLTGQDERDRRSRKQAMLFAVNRQLTRSINLLVEDINTFTKELLKQIKETQALEIDVKEKEQKMSELLARLDSLAVFSEGSELMVKDSITVETKAYKQNLPLVLNIERLRAITDEPTRRPFYDEILKLYQAKEEKNSEGEKVTVYRLRADLNIDEAEFLNEALNRLEYFSVSGLAKSGLASLKSLIQS